MLRVLIADEHSVVRRGVRSILSDGFDRIEVFDVGDGAHILKEARKRPLDIVVMEISMPGQDGLEVLKQLKRGFPKLPVLILTTHPEERFAVRAFGAGANGYLTKTTSPDELNNAIRKIIAGGKYVSVTAAELLANNLDRADQKTARTLLSDREYQVLRLLAAGKNIREIADELRLSVNTINTYRVRIIEKIDVKNNAGLVRYALEHGLVD